MMLHHLIFSGATAKHKSLRFKLWFAILFLGVVLPTTTRIRLSCSVILNKITWFLSHGMRQTFALIYVGIFALSIIHQLVTPSHNLPENIGISASDQDRLVALLEQTQRDDLITGTLALQPCGVDKAQSQ